MALETIEQYLRNELSSKWVKYIKKKECEFCKEKINLDLHHDISFVKILEETLNELGLKYNKDLSSYSETEIKLIRQLFLGKHYDYNVGITLCESCHNKIHKEYGKDSFIQIYNTDEHMKDKSVQYIVGQRIKEKNKILKEVKNKIKTNEIEEYLELLVGKRLFKEDQQKLINKIDMRINGEKRVSISCMNKAIKNMNLKYEIKSKVVKENKKSERCWVIGKM